MRIAILSEVSALEKNRDIFAALEGRGHTIINAGMREGENLQQLSYLHTGFLAGLLLNSGRVDMVVGGCGTGQGFLISALQYPGVFCGHITNSLDAWLFTQINGGNCISLPLNQGYGWAGNENLRFIFDRLFEEEQGGGYPESRREPQADSRRKLYEISEKTHRDFPSILKSLDLKFVKECLNFPGIREILDLSTLTDSPLKSVLNSFKGD